MRWSCRSCFESGRCSAMERLMQGGHGKARCITATPPLVLKEIR